MVLRTTLTRVLAKVATAHDLLGGAATWPPGDPAPRYLCTNRSLRGCEPAKAWLTEEAAKRDARFIYSVITLTELLSGLSGPSGSSGRNADGRQKEAILALLSLMDPIPVSVGIAARAADYVREWGRSRGVAVPDALIAATAEDVGAVLVTRDATHFPMTDIQVCRPY